MMNIFFTKANQWSKVPRHVKWELAVLFPEISDELQTETTLSYIVIAVESLHWVVFH